MRAPRGRTFGERALDFFGSLQPPRKLPPGIRVMNPYRDPRVWPCVKEFFRRYFADNAPRTLVFGINPGRFGAGVTGVMFTDPVALESFCGIRNELTKRRETSSEFVYEFIQRRGGPDAFYREFFLTAVSPLGFLRDGRNCNYYDDPRLLARVTPFIVRTLKAQLALGAGRAAAIVLGSGANHRFVSALNDEHAFFGRLFRLEHPRFIMQYRRKRLARYYQEYARVFDAARAANTELTQPRLGPG
jgi:hypothetical protein